MWPFPPGAAHAAGSSSSRRKWRAQSLVPFASCAGIAPRPREPARGGRWRAVFLFSAPVNRVRPCRRIRCVLFTRHAGGTAGQERSSGARQKPAAQNGLAASARGETAPARAPCKNGCRARRAAHASHIAHTKANTHTHLCVESLRVGQSLICRTLAFLAEPGSGYVGGCRYRQDGGLL